MKDHKTVVGVFENRSQAQKAVSELRQAGFEDAHIGVTGRDNTNSGSSVTRTDEDADSDSYAGEGAVAGLATGAGVGTLWGLGILAGVLPAIGPAIAAGSLAVLLSSAAAGAAAAGLAGSLIGMGVSKEEAEYYETEVKAGRILVTVQANGRGAEAITILRRNGGYDMTNRQPDSAATQSMSGAATTHEASEATSSMRDSAANMQRHNVDRPATPSNTTGRDTADRHTGDRNTRDRMGLDADQGQTVQAREEELRIDKQRVQTGEATIRKEVHTEHQSFEVPVEREELVIERRPIMHDGVGGTIGEGEEIRIPVSEEQVNIEKQTVAKEEVSIGKRKTQDTRHVDETLRKEEIKVETEGNVNIRDDRNV